MQLSARLAANSSLRGLSLPLRAVLLAVAIDAFGLVHLGGFGGLTRWGVVAGSVALMLVATRGRGGTRGWLLLMLGLMAFLEIRGVADNLGMPVHTEDLFRFEQIVFFGAIPSFVLQQRFAVLGQLGWLDYFSAWVYWSYFFVPYVAFFGVWLVKPRAVDRLANLLVLTFAAGLFIYALLPGTPPWLAAAQPWAPKIHRIMAFVGGALSPDTYDLIYKSVGDPNPIACLPSVHFAVTFVLFLYSLGGRRVWVGLTGLYSLAMLWTLVYLGEHYVVDCVFGALVAWAVWWGYGLWERRRRAAESEPAPLAP